MRETFVGAESFALFAVAVGGGAADAVVDLPGADEVDVELVDPAASCVEPAAGAEVFGAVAAAATGATKIATFVCCRLPLNCT